MQSAEMSETEGAGGIEEVFQFVEQSQSGSGPHAADSLAATTEIHESIQQVAGNDVQVVAVTDEADHANVDCGFRRSSKRARRQGVQSRSCSYPFSGFAELFYQLVAYKTRTGHLRVPTSDQPLGSWCTYVRKCYNEWKRKPNETMQYLTEERMAVLNSVGFVWGIQQEKNNERWKEQFAKLIEYKKRHGDCNAPQSTPLGKWVQMQRDQYREREYQESGQAHETARHVRKRPMIPLDRMEKLNAIGFQWRVGNQFVGWDLKFKELVQFKDRFGHCKVPQGWKENVALGRWVMKQRVQHNRRQKGEKSSMNDDRFRRLNEIGFVWNGQPSRNRPKSPPRHAAAALPSPYYS